MDHDAEPTRTIEVYADVVCPFTHVGLRRLFDLRDELRPDVAIVVRSWPLEVVNDEPVARDTLVEEIAALREDIAPELFEGFTPELFPLSTLPALALAAGAYRHGRVVGEAVSYELRDELFEQGHDVASDDVLATIADRHGLPPAGDADQQAVLDDLERGRARGVVGSPHFFVGDSGFFCPTLEIAHVGGRYEIAFDPEGFVTFMREALGPIRDGEQEG